MRPTRVSPLMQLPPAGRPAGAVDAVLEYYPSGYALKRQQARKMPDSEREFHLILNSFTNRQRCPASTQVLPWTLMLDKVWNRWVWIDGFGSTVLDRYGVQTRGPRSSR